MKTIYRADGEKFDASSKITRADAEREASFLKKWSKRNAYVVSQWTTGTRFWSQGKLMTQLEPAMVNALVEFGLATIERRGMIGWSKKVDPVQYVLGATPPADVEGITSIRLV